MYLPQIFCETDTDTLLELIRQYPLGMLISIQDGIPQADYLPFYVVQDNDELTLIAHFAKANPLAKFVDGADVLVVFMGEQGYISPNWYPTKQDHHRHVPTWNYQTIQVRGRATIFNDTKELMRAVGTLTSIHETKTANTTKQTPWKMADAPKDYLQEQLTDIVGLSISVHEMVGKFKLSQNREPVDFNAIITSLQQTGQENLAQAIKNTRQKDTH